MPSKPNPADGLAEGRFVSLVVSVTNSCCSRPSHRHVATCRAKRILLASKISRGLRNKLFVEHPLHFALVNKSDTIRTMSEKETDMEIQRKHSASHIMTATVQMLFGKEIGLGVGPWTDEGFYQDFDFDLVNGQGDTQVSESDLKKIEKKMRWIVNKNMPIKREVVSAEQALDLHKGDPYKEELIRELEKEGAELSVYYIGESLKKALSAQLCEGPHLASTGELGVFKLEHLAGAYWRGDEKNKMLTRIYGVAFAEQEQLNKHLEQIEEAKKRDHRKLGQDMQLFTISPIVGSGLPMFTPKGAMLRQLVTDKIWQLQSKFGWEPVVTPHITKKELYETSGHWEKFGDVLFKVKGKGDTEFVMKPMNCPHHTQIFAAFPKSYKDLPVRYAENGVVYRDEQAGELLGLSRVRHITQDDGHAFVTPEQIKDEVRNIVDIITSFYTDLGMLTDGNYWVSLSVSDPEHPEKYLISNDGLFLKAEQILEEIAKEKDLPYKKVVGEAAFYGPKLDFQFKDAMGREWQLGTVQLDFSLPQRFELNYTDKDGTKKTPVMIHRAIAGSLERFMAVMLEHTAGAFPLWLSPEQVRVLPIGDTHKNYAREIYQQLKSADIRVEIDDSNDTLGKRIRNVKTAKVPYYIVIGDDEVKDGTVTVESRDAGKLGTQKPDEFIGLLLEEIGSKNK